MMAGSRNNRPSNNTGNPQGMSSSMASDKNTSPSFDGRSVQLKPTVDTSLPEEFECTAATLDEFLADLEEDTRGQGGHALHRECDFDDSSHFSVESSDIGDLRRHLLEADDEFRKSLVRKLSEVDLFGKDRKPANDENKANPNMNTAYMEGYIKCLAPSFQANERRKLQQRESKKMKNRLQLVQGGIATNTKASSCD